MKECRAWGEAARIAGTSSSSRPSMTSLIGTNSDPDIEVYRTELRITSGILRDLNDTAFRNIGCN